LVVLFVSRGVGAKTLLWQPQARGGERW